MKSEAKLKKLAIDIAEGRVFTSHHIHPDDRGRMIAQIFLVFLLMKEEQIKEFESLNPYVLYEYWDNAGPMSVNGYPTFLAHGP